MCDFIADYVKLCEMHKVVDIGYGVWYIVSVKRQRGIIMKYPFTAEAPIQTVLTYDYTQHALDMVGLMNLRCHRSQVNSIEQVARQCFNDVELMKQAQTVLKEIDEFIKTSK